MSARHRNIIVTGATGFVGQQVVAEILKNKADINLYALVRRPTFFDENIKEIITEDISNISWLKNFSEKIDCIVHIAGAAHNKIDKKKNDSLDYFRKVNTFATKAIADEAAKMGTRRFIFISSIGVIGTMTKGVPFSDETPESPASDYTISKYEAELEIKKICQSPQSTMDFVIIRPPLVYGYNAPGNFSQLLKITGLGVPLPFLSVRNRRSLIDCSNLANFIVCCIDNLNASNQSFVIADDEAISTPDLIKQISIGMRSKTILFLFPVFIIKFCCMLIGKKNLYEQLCCSLEINSSRAKHLLQWSPPNKTRESLVIAADKYRNLTRLSVTAS